MNPCLQIDKFLLDDLSSEQRVIFGQHLEECALCQEQVKQWAELKLRLESRADSSRITPAQTQRLLARARAGARQRPIYRLAQGAAAAAALGILVAGSIVLLRSREEIPTALRPGWPTALRPARIVFTQGATHRLAPRGDVEVLEVPDGGRLLAAMGPDLIALDGQSLLRRRLVAPGTTRLELRRGTAAFQVAPRNRTAERFVVRVRGYRLAVLGTRFSVRLVRSKNVEVAVAEGLVRASGPEVPSIDLRAGQVAVLGPEGAATPVRLTPLHLNRIGALLTTSLDNARPPEPQVKAKPDQKASAATTARKARNHRTPTPVPRPAQFSIAQIRRMVLEKRFAEAEGVLVGELKASSDSGQLWVLVGDCRRKAGRPQVAVRAYLRAMAVARPATANRARFMAAVLLQDALGAWKRAESLLEQYLAQDKSLRPLQSEVMLRLARSKVRVGKREEARRLAERIVSEYRSHAAAAGARALLEGLR